MVSSASSVFSTIAKVPTSKRSLGSGAFMLGSFCVIKTTYFGLFEGKSFIALSESCLPKLRTDSVLGNSNPSRTGMTGKVRVFGVLGLVEGASVFEPPSSEFLKLSESEVFFESELVLVVSLFVFCSSVID